MGARRGDRFIGPYEVLNSHPVYEHPELKLREDRVRHRDGRESSFPVVTIPPGVTVLPMDEGGMVTLLRAFRYGVGETTLEAISGTIESGETPEQAGLRVIGAEAGLVAAAWVDMGLLNPCTDLLHSPTHLFLAQQLSPTQRSPARSEETEVVTMPFNDALYAVLRGQITHSASCVLILKTQQFLAKR